MLIYTVRHVINYDCVFFSFRTAVRGNISSDCSLGWEQRSGKVNVGTFV